ncbi:MAG: hypothetical protein OXU66_08540 [Gammaproteobacteria bacterium]|nr:hypothetical protein [Gammaproteobacteria bacterium]MDD9958977.1 hypothetical protein [Gammaproteobacteria bacterium]
MKDIILKNRYTLLVTVLAAYILVLVVEGAITDRQPDWLKFDNSLFTLDVRELRELEIINIDF